MISCAIESARHARKTLERGGVLRWAGFSEGIDFRTHDLRSIVSCRVTRQKQFPLIEMNSIGRRDIGQPGQSRSAHDQRAGTTHELEKRNIRNFMYPDREWGPSLCGRRGAAGKAPAGTGGYPARCGPLSRERLL